MDGGRILFYDDGAVASRVRWIADGDATGNAANDSVGNQLSHGDGVALVANFAHHVENADVVFLFTIFVHVLARRHRNGSFHDFPSPRLFADWNAVGDAFDDRFAHGSRNFRLANLFFPFANRDRHFASLSVFFHSSPLNRSLGNHGAGSILGYGNLYSNHVGHIVSPRLNDPGRYLGNPIETAAIVDRLSSASIHTVAGTRPAQPISNLTRMENLLIDKAATIDVLGFEGRDGSLLGVLVLLHHSLGDWPAHTIALFSLLGVINRFPNRVLLNSGTGLFDPLRLIDRSLFVSRRPVGFQHGVLFDAVVGFHNRLGDPNRSTASFRGPFGPTHGVFSLAILGLIFHPIAGHFLLVVNQSIDDTVVASVLGVGRNAEGERKRDGRKVANKDIHAQIPYHGES